MEKIWKNIVLPIVIIIVGIFLYRIVNQYIGFMKAELLELIRAFTFFAFGMSLRQYKKKRSSAWVGKLLISFVMFFLICFSLGYLKNFGNVINVMNFLGLTNQYMAIPMIYTLCGALFFD